MSLKDASSNDVTRL